MAMPTLLELAKAGAHFGHRRSLTNPKARGFVFATKNNVSVIDLEATQKQLTAANKVLAEYLAAHRRVLLVGTKRPTRAMVAKIATDHQIPFITERWYGGFLTNFSNFQKQIQRMNEREQFLQSSKAEKLDKKQRLRLQAELDRNHRFLGGVGQLAGLPELLIVAGASEDVIAIQEANRVGVPIIAIVDTDINPETVTYPIPANDDAPKAVELILTALFELPAAKPVGKAKAEKAVATTKEKPVKKVTAKKATAAKKPTEVKAADQPKAKTAVKKTTTKKK